MLSDLAQLASKADTFRRLHAGQDMLVMLNAWDAASARAFEAAGYPAVATTSGGVAAALGYKDHEDAPVDEMLAAATRIARSVSVPVTADLEAGYGLAPGDLARRAIATGAVGVNLEDTSHAKGALVAAEEQAERLAAFGAAARAEGVRLVLNARVDVFLRRVGTADEQLAEGIRRGRLYAQAGAECIYPLGLDGESAIAAFVQAVGCPVNVRASERGPSLARLAELGVRRVTYATGLFRRTLAAIENMARELHEGLPAAPRPER